MNGKKLVLLFIVIIAISVFLILDVDQYFSFQTFKIWVEQEPLLAAAGFFVLYIVITALSLPGAAIMTLMGGALFGLWKGLLLVSLASSIGGTLAFIVSRTLLRDWVEAKFSNYLQTINRGILKDGAYYLFTLRLIPVIPFVVINLVFGLTAIKTWTFYWVSQLGMLAGTFVYVNAGAELGELEDFSTQEIMTPGLLGAFVLLAIFPFIIRFLVGRIQNLIVECRYRLANRALYAAFEKPKKFDTNLVVIGGGSAGLVSSLIAAAVKAKVTLIEKHRMGGDCLNTGCVPSKTLIRSAKINHYIGRAHEYGIDNVKGDVNFSAVMNRVQSVIKKIEPHDSVERFTELGVDCVSGHAEILSPYQVRVDGRVITTKNIILASGARPMIPPIPGLDELDYLTSDNLWSLSEIPEQMLVLGAGPIGCELAQAFSRLGSRVTLVDAMDRVLPREDEDVSGFVSQLFYDEQINVLLSHKAIRFSKTDSRQIAVFDNNGEMITIEFDRLLVAVGRKANIEGMGLEALGVQTTRQGTIQTDKFLRTNFHTIYACGDVTGPYQFTHTAGHQGWYATVNALFGSFKKFAVDYSVIPWATFIDPEVARVGLNEVEAKENGIAYELSRYNLDDLDRAITDNEAAGFIKVLTKPKSDKILGVTIVGHHGSEIVTEFILAMKHDIGLNKILGTIHIYPTFSEASKLTAGVWKKANAPQTLLQWLKRYHAWRR